ncbi:hypothetical protein [Deinococcus sp. QL22]|uniref:hypothetical protein n=1 Tax=Deinococcus sp. QL22 TaxID=2939437 RepID=UPI002016FC91|nr:hypothetical protein [Deinococcus sp. QL22]UQN06296.1 hypothetical protein M1R55_15775 [Deinococcus sp. QL22]
MRLRFLLLFMAMNSAVAAAGGAGPLTTLQSTTHEVISTSASGRLEWKHAFPGTGVRVVSTGHIGPEVLVLTELSRQASIQDLEVRRLGVTLLSGKTGQALWHHDLQGKLDGSGEGTLPEERGWGVIDGTVWIARNSAGEMWTNDNFGFRIHGGTPVWETSGTGPPRAEALGEALFRAPTKAGMPNDPVNVKLLAVNTTTGTTRTLNLKIAERSGCGPLDDLLILENFLEVASARFFDAQRHDRCGYFVTRFDWHGSEQQTAIIRVP